MESHAEETGEAVIKRSGIRNEEDENNDGGSDLHSAAVIPAAEEIGHGGAPQMLGHDAGAAPQNHPGQQRADEGVAQTDPGGGDAVLPAELTGIPHKDHGGEVRGTVSKGGEPGPYRTSTQYKAADIGGMTAAIEADHQHCREEQ
ncbi:hypothetical protein SDC9_129144 [bioreactor metagenome]|uniref:Uncharacterized protein n=1 Tax=bioreactor metagenome TaxID=1076179 RepID=A0A645CY55_9ZZZZ